MVFIVFNLIAFFAALFLLVASIRNTILFWFVAYVCSLLIVLQLSSLYLGGTFVDYKFVAHLNYRDIVAMKHLYLKQGLLLTALFVVLPFAMRWLKSRVVKAKDYFKSPYRYLVIVTSVIIMSLNSGVINNLYKVVKIFSSADSSFIASLDELAIDNYILPDEVMAERGKNIIVISLESFEKGYLSESKAHLTPKIRAISKKWNYYDLEQTPGGDWTSGSLYTALTGVPCYFRGDGNSIFQDAHSTNITGIGHVLKRSGYDFTFYIEDAQFAGTKDLLNTFEITDIIDKTNISQRYGDTFKEAHDKDLFDAAKLEIIRKKKEKTPFAIFISTLDTHNPDGILDSRMEGIIAPQETQLEFMVASVDHMVGELVEFLENENMMSNTVVYIFPDHLKMGDPSIFNGTGERGLYLLTNADNSNLNPDPERIFSQLDLPRIILNGAEIKHNARFLAEYIDGSKMEYVNKNLSTITSLNNAGVKRKNILKDKVVIKPSKAGVVVEFEDFSQTVTLDTAKKFITRFSFSQEMKLLEVTYFDFSNGVVPPVSSKNIDLNFYYKGDTIFAYVQLQDKLPILKFDRSSVDFSIAEFATLSNNPSLIADAHPDNKLIFWEDVESIEVTSSPETDYSEYAVQIPYNIKEGFIDLEYSTSGGARPYVIVYGQPYSPASVALHDEVPKLTSSKSIRLHFDRSLENPILLFRNWSHDGRFKIDHYSIAGSGYYNDTRFSVRTENYDLYANDKNRFIAHAGGTIDGKTYTNSLEALNHNYNKGFRLFELDIIETSDGKFVAAHDWKHWAGLTHFIGELPVSEKEFLETPILGKYTPMSMAVINNWFADHKDAILVTDKVNKPKKFASEFIDKKRLMMELFSLPAVKQGIEAGIKSAILSEGVFKDLGKNKVAMLKQLGVRDLAISRRNIIYYVPFLRKLQKNEIHVFVYDVNFDPGKDESYVVNYEMDYIYGLYADTWDFK